MKAPRPPITVNVITGFLGVGKTSAILAFLRQQSGVEKWAVLVNEFGEVGIDGALLATSGFAVREVPGGCMCCAAGLPTRVALNNLIRDVAPDRILIEPTGLGHPANILAMLCSDDYADVLDVRATLTLIDPRVLNDVRYTGNENFIAQVEAADRLLASKVDLCTPAHLDGFHEWVAAVRPDATVAVLQDRMLQRTWLDEARQTPASANRPALPSLLTPQFSRALLPADQPRLRRQHQADGFFSCGWIFNHEYRFDFTKVFALLTNLDVLRCKAVLATDCGTFAFNLLDGALSVDEVASRQDSRIEFIAPEAINWDLLEGWLLQTQLA